MVESLIIFSIAAVGSLVRWSADVALKRHAVRQARETVGSVANPAWSDIPFGSVDPILRVGFTLACYGAIVLVLVSASPGELALERTGFAFALLCAGGLVGEISSAGVTPQPPAVDEVQRDAEHARRTSRALAMALTLTLNASIAVLTSGQRLIPIVTLTSATAQAYRLEPVVVVARRKHDALEEQMGSELAGL